MQTKIIGIAGKAGHGKSTIAGLIMDSTVERVEVISFATPLKQLLLKIFPYLRLEHLTDQELKSIPIPRLNDKTPRQLMQTFGTEFARSFDDAIWMYHAELRIKEIIHSKRQSDMTTNFIVFDDVRFENEVELIRSYSGTIIHLERNVATPKQTWFEKLVPKKNKVHSSEAGVRHLYQEENDFIINTGVDIEKTKADVLQLAACRFDKNYEV